MGACIYKVVSKKGFDILPRADAFPSVFETKIHNLLDSPDADKITIGSHCENKKAILFVNVATKWGLTD